MERDFTEPASLKDFIYKAFKTASKNRNHWLRQGVLASSDANGKPSARMVVIRHVSESLELEMHTDARSAKIDDFKKNPQAEILCYDPVSKTQLKCYGNITLITSGTKAQAAWEKVPENSKKQYTTSLAPGTVIPHKAPIAYQPTSHFCMVQLKAEVIEYLQLGQPPKRHRLHYKEGQLILENLVP